MRMSGSSSRCLSYRSHSSHRPSSSSSHLRRLRHRSSYGLGVPTFRRGNGSRSYSISFYQFCIRSETLPVDWISAVQPFCHSAIQLFNQPASYSPVPPPYRIHRRRRCRRCYRSILSPLFRRLVPSSIVLSSGFRLLPPLSCLRLSSPS